MQNAINRIDWISVCGSPGGFDTAPLVYCHVDDYGALFHRRDEFAGDHLWGSPAGNQYRSNGCIGLPDILLHQPGLSETMIDSLTMIRDAGHIMLNQINLSLDLFKMEQGSYELEPESVDILALMREVLPQIDQFVRVMQLRVEMERDGRRATPDDRFFVFGEKLLCLSMLSNLLKNAAEASPQGGTITIGLKTVHGGSQITIHNQGAIPAAIRNRLFEKYVTAGKRHGTGLGAYSAALIARTQGGTISATSSEDAGTTISVVLPGPPAEKPQA